MPGRAWSNSLAEVTAVSLEKRTFYVVIEQDEDGYYIGEAPQLRACYSQGKTIDELMANIKEVIELCLEEDDEVEALPEFVGVQKVVV
jgi:predicted RNase H-like HicB family nuclease